MLPIHLSAKFLRVLSSFLTGRTIKVKVGNQVSEEVLLNAGTPQGSVLSPILFIIYVNDITITPGTSVSQYADDLGLYVTVKNHKYIHSKLQGQLRALEKWCSLWHVKLNASKTKLVIISHIWKTINKPKINLTLFNNVIEQVTSACLLGATLDDRMKLVEHTDNRINKANNRINDVYKG